MIKPRNIQPPRSGNTPKASTIGAINRLPENEKREIYARTIPRELLQKFKISAEMVDQQGRDLLNIATPANQASVEIWLYHQFGFTDPVLYGHLTDTINEQIHILFYVLNDPEAQRYDIDRLPDGTFTQLGTQCRNIEAEVAAMQAGLSPGQIRRGPHLLRAAMNTFETFIQSLDHSIHFAEPLYYHNAIIFEHFGFAYQKGRRLMERIQRGFDPGGDLINQLDGSTPFRQPAAAHSIRLRSWAIHDGIMGDSFQDVTMYKEIGKYAEIKTCSDCPW